VSAAAPAVAPVVAGAAPAPALAEVQLSALWRGRRFPRAALVTRAGVPVTVIFQGRAGRGPGPDFRGAVVAGPSGVPLRGDVELHVRASHFRQHGHHRDPAYAGVILHVVFEDDTGEDTPLPGGGTAPVIALAPWVARRAGELAAWLDRPLLWREPCHDSVTRMGLPGVLAALETEGQARFEARAAALAGRAAFAGVEQALYEALLECLGYGGNAVAMRALAAAVPWPRLAAALAAPQPRPAAEALLIGAGGLLPSARGHRGPVEPYVAALEAAWRARRAPALSPALWKLWGVRPENAAARRVAAAASLFARLGAPSAALSCAEARSASTAVAPLLVSADGYWRNHHDTCAAPCRLPPALVGRSRALEMLINAVLPLAAALGGARAARARALYAALPRPAVYGVTRFIETALASEGVRVPVNARRAQGLLALHRDWCTQGGCGRCVLS
jgi:hypothetical protein